jgi:maltooligosyltrehalose synthase
VPVPVRGQLARHCIAYARRNERHGILVLATRLYHELGYADSEGGVWSDESVDLGAAGIRARNFVDLLTAGPASGEPDPASAGPSPRLRLDERLATLPLAVLSFDVDQDIT